MRVDKVYVDHLTSVCVLSSTAFQLSRTWFYSGACKEAVKPVGALQAFCAKPLIDNAISAVNKKNNAFLITIVFW